MTRQGAWMRARLAAGLLAMLLLGGCAGAVRDSELAAQGSLPAMLRVAEKNAAAGNHATAARLYRAARQRYPEAAEPPLGLGRALYRLGAYEEAAAAYREVLALAPDSRDGRYGLGKTLIALDRPEAASQALAELLRRAPDSPRARLAMGVALDMQDRHAAAQAQYRRGLEAAPGHVGLRNNLGLSLALAGDHDGAIAVLRRLAAEPGAGSRVRQNLALAYGLAGRHEAAAAVASVDLEPQAVEANLAYYRAVAGLADGTGGTAPDRLPSQARRESGGTPATAARNPTRRWKDAAATAADPLAQLGFLRSALVPRPSHP